MTENKQTLEDSLLSPPVPPMIPDELEANAILTTALKSVCEETDWEYAEVWIPKANNTILELIPAQYISTRVDSDRQLAWEQFRSCSEEFVLHPGEGLPGRVRSSQQPEWIADVSIQSESYFLRNQIAKAFGAKSAFGVPVVEGQIGVVLAFFMSKVWDDNSQLIASTQVITTQFNPLLLSVLN
jgi:hypothetical protein